ncbi:MAG: hypothetical protein Q4D20_02830 [Clostridia bacterium]|nr:hypothetical protein [Clostridia bacterium]
MKTMKKTISLVLVLCMFVSSLAVAFVAFAGEDDVTKATEAVNALIADKTSITGRAPTDEAKLEAYKKKLALYDAAVSAYKALSVEEKDAFDVQLTLNILKAVTERESFLIKEDFDSKLPEGSTWKDQMSAIESRIRATALLDEKLGEHPVRTQTLEFANKYLGTKHKCNDGKEFAISSSSNFTKYPELIPYAKEYIEAYKSAPQLVRMYLDGYSASFASFSSNIVGSVFSDVIKITGKINLAENPFAGTGKPTITNKKPNAKNYAGGTSDPEYIAALNLYLADKKTVVEYDQKEKNYEYNFYIEAIKAYKDIIPEAKTACEVALALYEGYIDFETTGNTEKAKAGMKVFDEMTGAYDSAFYKKLGSVYAYYLVYLNSKKDDYAYNNVMISQLYAKCEETAGMTMIAEFEKWLEAIDLDSVTNEIIAEAEAKYKEIPRALLSKISDEAEKKYSAILALYDPTKPLTPSDYKFENEISDFSSVNGLASIPGVNKAFNIVAAVENKIATVVYKTAVKTLLKNENVSVVGALYKYIVDANIIASGINISSLLSKELRPSDMASFITEEKYAGAKAKLLAAAEKDDSVNAYSSIKFENGDWGFENGDAQGFANALAVALRPIVDILHNGILIISNIIYLPNSTSAKGDYVYGAYEELIPILEGIGLEGVISSEEYTEKFYAAQKGEKYDYLDSLILPVLVPVVNLITKLENNVVFTIYDILPNVARTIDTGLLDSQIHAFLKKSSTLGGIEVNLSGDAVNEMLSGLSFTVSLGKMKIKIGFRAINWNRLSRSGSLRTVESKKASNLYRLDVKADRAKVQENIARSIKISF